MLERVKKSAPALIKGHREDIVQLLAALAGVTPEAYAESLNLFKLTSDIVDLMTDPEFLGLFPSAETETDAAVSGSCIGEYHGPSTVNAFLTFCAARFDDLSLGLAFQCYVAECLNSVMDAVSGKRLTDWMEIVLPGGQPEEPCDAEEVAADLVRRIAEKKAGE